MAAIFDIIYAGLIWIIPNKIIDKDKKEWKETIFQKKYAKNIFIALMIMIFQQFCGINAINDHLTEIMSNTGLDINSNLQAALSSMCQLLSVLIAAFNMDGIGRKKLWAFSSSGIVISQILYIVAIKVIKKGWFQAFSVFVYLLSFGHGLGPIPWFIVHDLFPRYIRLDAQTMVTFVYMICSFGVTCLFPVMKKKIDEYLIMIIFMCITAISLPFGLYFIPKKSNQNDECLTLI